MSLVSFNVWSGPYGIPKSTRFSSLQIPSRSCESKPCSALVNSSNSRSSSWTKTEAQKTRDVFRYVGSTSTPRMLALHHQDYYILVVGNPNLNIHLWLVVGNGTLFGWLEYSHENSLVFLLVGQGGVPLGEAPHLSNPLSEMDGHFIFWNTPLQNKRRDPQKGRFGKMMFLFKQMSFLVSRR